MLSAGPMRVDRATDGVPEPPGSGGSPGMCPPPPALRVCCRAVYGAAVAKHVLPLTLKCGAGEGEDAGEDELSCSIEVRAC